MLTKKRKLLDFGDSDTDREVQFQVYKTSCLPNYKIQEVFNCQFIHLLIYVIQVQVLI